MASTVNLTSWSKRYSIPVGSDAEEIVISTTTNASYMALNDVNKIAKLEAKGVTVDDCFVQIAAADTHATPTAVFDLQITDGTTTKTLISGSTVAQAGGIIRPTKVPATEDGVGFTTTNKNFYLALKWTTAAATAAAVAVKVGLRLSGSYLAGAVTE